MKKCLIVTTLQGTIKAFLIPHIKMLEQMGYEVWIATKIDKEIPNELKQNKWINIDFSRNPFSKKSFKALGQLKKLFDENDFEIVHCHTPVAAFLTRFITRLKEQKNVIYTAHGFHFYKGAPLINWLIYYPLERVAARWTDKIITINEEDYQNSLKFKLKKKGSCHKINGVGVNLERFKTENIIFTGLKERLGLKDEDFILLTLAELNKNKNQIQTLKALKEIIKEYKNIKYLLAGNGSEKEKLENFCKKNNLQDNVIFLGLIEYELIPELINISDIIVSTSIREGLGLNLLEGIAGGKAIIATRNRGHKEVIIEGQNGFLVEINDHLSLAKKIEGFIKKEKNIEKNIEMIKKFYLENILKELKNILEI